MKVINLIYKFGQFKQRYIRLFSKTFLKNNKRKCKLIIENKISPLKEIYHRKDYETKIIKVKLLLFDGCLFNFRNMFYNCNSLVEFYEEKSQKESIIENNINEKQKESEINDHNENDELSENHQDFYAYENSYLNEKSLNTINPIYINKKAQKLYFYINGNKNSEVSIIKNNCQRDLSIEESEISIRDNVMNES